VEIDGLAQEALDSVRAGEGPFGLILHTYRFAPHSKGDDYRDPAEIARFRERDPLLVHAARLGDEERQAIRVACEAEVRQAFEQALSAPMAEASIRGDRS
jgi:TPP-dependent pyruvate/acetoin dehydrogenase alpha subunit